MRVNVWWAALCVISAVNAGAWALTWRGHRRRTATMDPALRARRRWQLVFSGVFMAVCAFRSVFPRADVQRICLLDSWLSSVLIGRSAATIAELCFVAQWVLLLRELASGARARFATAVAALLLPLIAVAELCSWCATLTTSYLGNAFEESLWTISAVLLVLAAISIRRHASPRHRSLLTATILIGSAYVIFMCTVDVPMYVSRWLADQAAGRRYLSLGAGLADVSRRFIVTRSWDEWRTEIPWMSFYFSAGVWTSLALVRMPFAEGLRQGAPVTTGAAARRRSRLSAVGGQGVPGSLPVGIDAR
jgi:hypothetical protein